MYIERLTSKIYRIHKPSIAFRKKFKNTWIYSSKGTVYSSNVLPKNYDWAFTFDAYSHPKKISQKNILMSSFSNVPLDDKEFAFELASPTDLRLLLGREFRFNKVPDINVKYFEELGLKDSNHTVEELVSKFIEYSTPYSTIDLAPIVRDEDVHGKYNLTSCVISYNYFGPNESELVEKFNNLNSNLSVTINNNVNNLANRIKDECKSKNIKYTFKNNSITLKYQDLCKCDITYTVTDLIY